MRIRKPSDTEGEEKHVGEKMCMKETEQETNLMKSSSFCLVEQESQNLMMCTRLFFYFYEFDLN